MPLPPITKIKLEDSPLKVIRNIQISLERLRAGFENASGEAIDPSEGSAGGGALTITDPPTNITYTAGVETSSVNKTNDAFIDITFTLPARAVGVEIYYRELPLTNKKQSYANTSPYRLIALRAGSTYELQLAGEAANGSIGPLSPLTQVTIESVTANIAPADAHYVVTQLNADLTNEHILTGEATVIDITATPGDAKVGILPLGVSTAKIADLAVTTGKIADLAVTTAKIDNLAVTTAKVADNNITDAKLVDRAALSVMGRAVGTTGDVADIVAASDNTMLTRVGGVLAFTPIDSTVINTGQLADNSVTNAKLRDSAALSVIGRSVNSAGDPADIAASANGLVLQRQADVVAFSGAVQTVLLTATGFDAVVQVTARYVVVGLMVMLFMPAITGTSNATTFTIGTLPVAIRSSTDTWSVTRGRDNGVFSIRAIRHISTGIINFYPDGASGGWTASGIKSVDQFYLSYFIG